VKHFGVREKKAALLKVSILGEMLRLLEYKNLNDITVDELCANINTTKVTFFNYFHYKEQVLDYFVQKWLYDRSFDIHCKRFSGEEGLYHVFQSICEDFVPGKKIMISLIHYYSKLTEKPAAIELSSYEYYLFNAKAFEQKVKPLNLQEVFTYYLSEIPSIHSSRYTDVAVQLLALMYGVPIQTHIMELNDMYPFYQRGLYSILRGNCT
jgi:AcrR family transcriptional regulator